MDNIELNQLLQIGAGGALAVVLVRSILDFITKMKSHQESTVYQSLEKTLDRLCKNIEKQTEALQQNLVETRVNSEAIRRFSDDVQRVKKGVAKQAV